MHLPHYFINELILHHYNRVSLTVDHAKLNDVRRAVKVYGALWVTGKCTKRVLTNFSVAFAYCTRDSNRE